MRGLHILGIISSWKVLPVRFGAPIPGGLQRTPGHDPQGDKLGISHRLNSVILWHPLYAHSKSSGNTGEQSSDLGLLQHSLAQAVPSLLADKLQGSLYPKWPQAAAAAGRHSRMTCLVNRT